MTDIAGQAVVVTGANGGLGREWVAQALERGAAKVYATDVTLGTWDDSGWSSPRTESTSSPSTWATRRHR
jgi:hypothetical protein